MSKVVIYEEMAETTQWIPLILEDYTCIDIGKESIRNVKQIEELVIVTYCTSFGLNANLLRLCSYLERKLVKNTTVRVVLFSEEKEVVSKEAYHSFFEDWSNKAELHFENVMWIPQSIVFRSKLNVFQKKKLSNCWKRFISSTSDVDVTMMPSFTYGTYVNSWVKEAAKQNHMEEHLEDADKYFVYLSRERSKGKE